MAGFASSAAGSSHLLLPEARGPHRTQHLVVPGWRPPTPQDSSRHSGCRGEVQGEGSGPRTHGKGFILD